MRILIVEDETMVAKSLIRVLGGILGQRIQHLHHADSLESAENYLQSHEIDLMFLDLNLSGDDGFSLLADMVTRNFQTIIVSGNTDQALRSYEYGVLDFVAKPFSPARLSHALDRYESVNVPTESGRGKAKFLGVRHIGKTVLVPVDEITHIKASERYSELCLGKRKTHLHEKNLKQLLPILPAHFQRVHKSHVVNLEFARNIVSKTGSKYELHMFDGTILSVGRKFLPDLRKHLG